MAVRVLTEKLRSSHGALRIFAVRDPFLDLAAEGLFVMAHSSNRQPYMKERRKCQLGPRRESFPYKALSYIFVSVWPLTLSGEE